MKISFRLAMVGTAALTIALPGCGLEQHPAYSSSVRYGLRTDPIVRAGGAPKLGEERHEPDRPGIFPIMKLDDMNQPEHPYHAKMKDLDDKILRDPSKLPEKERKDLEAALEEVFGTPGKPSVNAKVAGIDEKMINELKLDTKTLEMGSTRYRIHCLHCHGVPGDGRGPTARWINPHPRDFRAGIFKFQSVDQTTKQKPPARADLLRTLRQGIEGTAMPNFSILQDDELEAMVSYVVHLSLRGKVELTTMVSAFDFDKGALSWNSEEGDMKSNVKAYTALLLKEWSDSNLPASAIKVAKYPFDSKDPGYAKALEASVRRGQQIFAANPSPEFQKELFDVLYPRALAEANKGAKEPVKGPLEQELRKKTEEKALTLLKTANCASCHTDYGRQARFRFDDWGTLVRPNNLYLGNLRGGKRPVDVYYRIHSGISGSGMTPFGKVFEGQEHYIWDLVNFVTIVPYPTMRDSLKMRVD